MQTFVTGGTGFIGGAVVRALLAAGHQVRVLVRPGSDLRGLADLPVDVVRGDLAQDGDLQALLVGCEWVFHVAALYSYWGHPWRDFERANVEGTRRLMRAAADCGAGRVVYTSSVAVLGIPHDGSPGTEVTPSTLADMVGDYKRSKYLAEEVVHEFAAKGRPVVIVNPSTPVGAGDWKPTPTGRIIVDFLNGRMPAYVDTGLNLVDVEDVARGHLLAAERGRIGERYILGAENLTLQQVLDMLAQISGHQPARWRVPHAAAWTFAWLDVTMARLNVHHQPAATPATVRLSRKHMYFDPGKAVRELCLPQTPVREALRKAVDWYRTHGYVTERPARGARPG